MNLSHGRSIDAKTLGGLPAERAMPTFGVPRLSSAINRTDGRARRVGIVMFLFIVCLPTFSVGLYYGFIASNQYVAETKMALREGSPALDVVIPTAPENASPLSMISKFVGHSQAGKDSYVVVAYLRSRDIVELLDRDAHLRTIFSSPKADFYARFDPKLSKEELWRYWQDMVSVSVDSLSGIIRVRATAFRPEDAVWLCDAMAKQAELMVNAFTSRGRRDALATAKAEQNEARERFIQTTTALRHFRDSRGTIDPVEQATTDTLLLFDAMKQRSSIGADKSATTSLAANAPALGVIDAQLRALDEQVAKLNRVLTSPDQNSRATSAAFSDYEQLQLEKLFSEKFYTIANDAVDKAQDALAYQREYLTTFVPAVTPETSTMPRRSENTLAVFTLTFMIWSLARLSIATILV